MRPSGSGFSRINTSRPREINKLPYFQVFMPRSAGSWKGSLSYFDRCLRQRHKLGARIGNTQEPKSQGSWQTWGLIGLQPVGRPGLGSQQEMQTRLGLLPAPMQGETGERQEWLQAGLPSLPQEEVFCFPWQHAVMLWKGTGDQRSRHAVRTPWPRFPLCSLHLARGMWHVLREYLLGASRSE